METETVALALRFGGKRFMWDGHNYDEEAAALAAAEEYRARGFQVELAGLNGRHYVYTRREVKETDGQST